MTPSFERRWTLAYCGSCNTFCPSNHRSLRGTGSVFFATLRDVSFFFLLLPPLDGFIQAFQPFQDRDSMTDQAWLRRKPTSETTSQSKKACIKNYFLFMARSVPCNQMTFLSSSVKLEHTHLCSVSFISLTLTFHLRTASPQLISIQIQISFSLWGGKKGLISLSLVKKKKRKKITINIPIISPPGPNILTFAQSHTVVIQSSQIQLTWCKVSWKTDVAWVTYRNLLIAFHCLTFPFIHSNPLTMELRDVGNDGVSLHEWEESQEEGCRGSSME